jgi:hypothetical protein
VLDNDQPTAVTVPYCLSAMLDDNTGYKPS